jgi:radical SAM superfamily enzyme YgiQ (UPF0313 family)
MALNRESKVLLLNPGGTQLVTNFPMTLVPPGLQEIFFFLYERGVDVSLLDCRTTPFDQLAPLLTREKYDIIGITVNFSFDYRYALKLLHLVRSLYGKSTRLVVGGMHATARPYDFLSQEEDRADHVVLGYGERILLDMARGSSLEEYHTPDAGVLEDQKIHTDVPVIRYQFRKAYEEGRLTVAHDAPLCAILFARGCINRCAYCVLSGHNRPYKPHALDNVLANIHALADNLPPTVHEITVEDPCFGYHAEWRSEVTKAFASLPHLTFNTANMVRALQDGGVDSIQCDNIIVGVGVESFSPQMLAIMHKTHDPETYVRKAKEVLLECSRRRFATRSYTLIDHPGETVQTRNKTLDTIEDIAAKVAGTRVSFSVYEYQHFPGTYAYIHQAFYEKEYGARFFEPQWWKYAEKYQLPAAEANIPSAEFWMNSQDIWEMLKNKMSYRFRLRKIPDLQYIAG